MSARRRRPQMKETAKKTATKNSAARHRLLRHATAKNSGHAPAGSKRVCGTPAGKPLTSLSMNFCSRSLRLTSGYFFLSPSRLAVPSKMSRSNPIVPASRAAASVAEILGVICTTVKIHRQRRAKQGVGEFEPRRGGSWRGKIVTGEKNEQRITRQEKAPKKRFRHGRRKEATTCFEVAANFGSGTGSGDVPAYRRTSKSVALLPESAGMRFDEGGEAV